MYLIFFQIIVKYKMLIDDLFLVSFQGTHKLNLHGFVFFSSIYSYLAADGFEGSWAGLLPPRDPTLLWKARCTMSGTGKSAIDLT